MSDLISREEILKHIEKIRQGVQMMDDTHRASIIMNGMHLCEKAVMNQPSAQPEIIRCKDCKHIVEHKGYGDLGESAYTCEGNMSGWILPDSYCSMAERREDG